MKKIIILLSLTMFLFACKQHKKVAEEFTSSIHPEYYGNWVGDFIAEEYKPEKEYMYINKINIKIVNISSDNKVTAMSIVAGNKRSLKGDYDALLKKFVLKEPGDNKYDGTFIFTVANDTLKGEWTSYDTSLPVTKRTFQLTKMNFVYNKILMLPTDGEYVDYFNSKSKEVEVDSGMMITERIYRSASKKILEINASTMLLKEADLKNLKKLDMEIIRNTIFARHGYTFKKKVVRQFFDPVIWYVPMYDDVKDKLTEIEIKNIALLSRFEKYAEDNYETFGR